MTAPIRNITPKAGNTSIRDTSAQDTVRVTRRPTWLKPAGFGLVALILAGVVWSVLQNFLFTDAAINAQRLHFATVERGSFSRDVTAPGLVIAAVSPAVYAQTAGTVTLEVKAGDLVEQGDILARIESPELSNTLAQERATLQSLDTNLQRRLIEHKQQALRSSEATDVARMDQTAAERELRRATAAWEIKVIARQDFEKARDDVERASMRFEHAQAAMKLELESLDFELQTLRLERDRQALRVDDLARQVAALSIAAPVSGMVGTVNVAQKESVSANQALMSVVDLTAFEVEARIAQSYAERLAPGMTATIRYGSEEHTGQLRAISPEVTNNTVLARIRFNQTPEGLRQNQRVTTQLTLESVDNALTLPRGAFIDSGGGRAIYVVNDDIATRRNIRLGASSDGRVEIIDGLSEGERVITSSIDLMRGAETIFIKR